MKFEQALYGYRSRKKRYTIQYFLDRDGVFERMDRTENQLFERALNEKEVLRVDNGYYKQYTKSERRSRMFASFTPEELRDPITLKSWIEALANLSEKKVESLYDKFMRRLPGSNSWFMRTWRVRLPLPR